MLKKDKISLFPVLLVNFIGTLGYSIILPFLIVIVLDYGGNELIYGIMGATYSFFQFIGAPVLGNWSDKFGRKKILVLSQAGTAIAWLIFLIALMLPNLQILNVNSGMLGIFVITVPLAIMFLARALDGLTGGNVSVANAYLADITTEENRKSNYGKMGVSANLGFIIGPAIAGILGGTMLGVKLPVLFALCISIAAIVVIKYLMPESKTLKITDPLMVCKTKKLMGQELKDCYKIESENKKMSFRKVWEMESVPLIITLYFLIFLSFNFFYVAFPVYAVQTLEWNLAKLGIFFSLLSLILVIVEGPVLTKLSKSFSDKSLTLIGSILLSLGFYLLTLDGESSVYLSAVLFSVGNGLMWPSFLSILSKIAGNKYQGAVQGYASSMGSLASILGLIAGGVIYGQIGNALFFIPSVIMIIILIVLLKVPVLSR